MPVSTNVLAAAKGGDTHAHLPDYIDYDAYVAGWRLSRCLSACAPANSPKEDLLKALDDASLRGLGGAGFPTGRKWRAVLGEPGPRLMAINGDEGEPGTFKDRYYLETDPHRFLEGMLIGAHVVEAPDIYIYIRDEYPASREILDREIAKLPPGGPSAASAPRRRRLYLRRGVVAAGEHRGQARIAAPQAALPVPGRAVRPADADQQHRDVVVGARHRRKRRGLVDRVQGRNERHGLRSYSVSGRVKNPGMKLAPAGITVRELIDEFCGGMADGHTFHAYLPGGASGGILPASMDDIPLDFGTLEKYGCFIGSAAVIILSEQDSVKGCGAEPDAFLRGRELRPVHAVPGRHPEGGAADGTAGLEPRTAR